MLAIIDAYLNRNEATQHQAEKEYYSAIHNTFPIAWDIFAALALADKEVWFFDTNAHVSTTYEKCVNPKCWARWPGARPFNKDERQDYYYFRLNIDRNLWSKSKAFRICGSCFETEEGLTNVLHEAKKKLGGEYAYLPMPLYRSRPKTLRKLIAADPVLDEEGYFPIIAKDGSTVRVRSF